MPAIAGAASLAASNEADRTAYRSMEAGEQILCLRDASEPERLANMAPTPRYPGELFFAVSTMLLIILITVWVVANMVAEVSDFVPWGQHYLLVFLGIMAFMLGVYIFKMGLGTQMWIRAYEATKDRDFYAAWQEIRTEPGVKEWRDVQHFVIVVTTCEEPVDFLKSVAFTLMSQRTPLNSPRSFCQQQVTLVLAMEELEGQCAKDKVREVDEALRNDFRSILAFYHPQGLAGEIRGKASNYRWAVGELDERLRNGLERLVDDRGTDTGPVPMDSCILHKADGDSLFDPNHLPAITFDFCRSPARYERVWQPCVIPTCNFWELPFCSRQMSILVAAQEMLGASGSLGMPEFQLPLNTYSLSLEALRRIGGRGGAGAAQDGDAVAEDHHLFIKGFCATEGRLVVRPVYLPCFITAVVGCEWASRTCCLSWLFFCSGRTSAPRARRVCDSRFTQATQHLLGIAEFAFFFSLLRRGGCKFRFGRRWFRVVGLGMKLCRIHSLSYQGLWITLGAVLMVMYHSSQETCRLKKLIHPHSTCDERYNPMVATFGAWIFSVAGTFALLGSMFVVVSFVKMLRVTQSALRSIADPNRSFATPGTRCRDPRPLRHRLVTTGQGGAWLGTSIQLILECITAGLATSYLYYGMLPGFVALCLLIKNGHRMAGASSIRSGIANA